MTLPASGSISLSQVNVELNKTSTTTIALNNSDVRTLFGKSSGTISMFDGYGKSNTFSFPIADGTTNANLRSLAISAGWNGTSILIANIGSGSTVYSTSTGTPAMTISGSFPNGVTLNNAGTILGKGGAGGGGAAASDPGINSAGAGGAGGLGLSVSSAVSINNTGVISGGGGGGGGGGEYKYTYGKGLNGHSAGSGGGGGIGNGSAGAAGSGAGWGVSGNPGNVGTLVAAGSGGTSVGGGGVGGNGGSYGSGGGSGTQPFPYSAPGGGGAAGGCLTGNANITWVSTGTRYGGIA